MNKTIIFLFIPFLDTNLPFYPPPFPTPNSALKTIEGSILNQELTNMDIPQILIVTHVEFKQKIP